MTDSPSNPVFSNLYEHMFSLTAKAYKNIVSSDSSISNPVGSQIPEETTTLKVLETIYLTSSGYPEADLEIFQQTTKEEIT